MINYPDINPVAISIPFSGFWGNSIDIHWYALAYVVGAYLIYFHMLSTRKKFGIKDTKIVHVLEESNDLPVLETRVLAK